MGKNRPYLLYTKATLLASAVQLSEPAPVWLPSQEAGRLQAAVYLHVTLPLQSQIWHTVPLSRDLRRGLQVTDGHHRTC